MQPIENGHLPKINSSGDISKVNRPNDINKNSQTIDYQQQDDDMKINNVDRQTGANYINQSPSKMHMQMQNESPKQLIKNYKVNQSRGSSRLYDSLDNHMNDSISKITQKDMYDSSSSPYSRFIGTTREDVKRNSLEQDRYFSRLNSMNNKQLQIYQKHLEHHMTEIKHKEKLEERERKKREETKKKLDQLEIGSKMHQRALKNQYQKFLNNQMQLRVKQNQLSNQAKREQLNEMKMFSKLEKDKEKDEKIK